MVETRIGAGTVRVIGPEEAERARGARLGDVDLEHGVVQINKAIDRETGNVKSTTSGETRRIPIEPELRPLLERLYEERTGERVLWMPSNEDRAVMLRQHLAQADVKRADLFAYNERQKHVTFHDLRATGITWMAVRGDDPLRIKQRAGHAGFSTTEMYIREAENLIAGFGEPFPTLPEDLVGNPVNRPRIVRNERSSRNDKWSNGGSNTKPRPLQSSRMVLRIPPFARRKTTPSHSRFRLRLPRRTRHRPTQSKLRWRWLSWRRPRQDGSTSLLRWLASSRPGALPAEETSGDWRSSRDHQTLTRFIGGRFS
jgi:hypothetical protein